MGKRKRSSSKDAPVARASEGADLSSQKKESKRKKKKANATDRDGAPGAAVVHGSSEKMKKRPKQRPATRNAQSLISAVSITEPSAEDAFFHGAFALPLPSGSVIASMDANDQHAYLKKVTSQCEKVIYLLDDCLRVFNNKEEDMSVEEQLTADMVRLKKLPLAKQYVELTLWRRARLFGRERVAEARRLGYGRGEVQRDEADGLLLHRTGDPDAKFVSYREAYLKEVVERYQTDFEKIREQESLDAGQTDFLLNCLGAAADLFANFQCINEKEGDHV